MALISKMNRCAVCGSSEVVYDKASGMYHCPTCGEDRKEPMPLADLTAVNRIAVLGYTDGKLDELRSRYPRLDVLSWNKEDRLQA